MTPNSYGKQQCENENDRVAAPESVLIHLKLIWRNNNEVQSLKIWLTQLLALPNAEIFQNNHFKHGTTSLENNHLFEKI